MEKIISIFQSYKVADEQGLLKKMFPAPGLCLAFKYHCEC